MVVTFRNIKTIILFLLYTTTKQSSVNRIMLTQLVVLKNFQQQNIYVNKISMYKKLKNINLPNKREYK